VAADFSINPAAARMRWSRLKKTINVDDIASSMLDGKKRRTAVAVSKTRASQSSSSSSSCVKMERSEDDALQLPLPSPSAAGITLKEEEEGEELAEQEELAPALFARLPMPPKCRGTGAEEQVSIPVVDEAVRAIGRFAATQVPHLPRVAEAVVVGDPETGSQPPVPVVQDPPTLKSEPKPQLGEGEGEGGKTMKSEPPSTDTICENAGSTVTAVPTAANGSKKRKVEST